MSIGYMGLRNSQGWGGFAINCQLTKGYNYAGDQVYRQNLSKFPEFLMFALNEITYGNYYAGAYRIKVEFLTSNKTYYIKSSRTGSKYEFPVDPSGKILPGADLVKSELTTSDSWQIGGGSWFESGAAYGYTEYLAVSMDNILNTVGLKYDIDNPEKILISYYSDYNEVPKRTDLLYMYKQGEYPKIQFHYTGQNLQNGIYYDNVSTMKLGVTISDIEMYKDKKMSLSINLGTDITTIIQLDDPVSSSNPIISTYKEFTYTTFSDTLYITAKNSEGVSQDVYAQVPYFAYTPLSCYESTAYRIGDDYEIVKLDAVGNYSYNTQFPVTLSYRWKYKDSDFGNWNLLATGGIGTHGPLKGSAEIISPKKLGEVVIQVRITDTVTESTYLIYSTSQPLFEWNGEQLNFTIPISISTDLGDDPMIINGLTLDDYIRSIN